MFKTKKGNNKSRLIHIETRIIKDCEWTDPSFLNVRSENNVEKVEKSVKDKLQIN